MMFAKSCSRCDRAATVEMDGRPLCSEHAFEKIKAAKGVCPQPRRIGGPLKIRA